MMGKLEQQGSEQAFSIGWYGSCDEDPCVDFDLGSLGANIKDSNGADAAHRVLNIADVTGNNISWKFFSPTSSYNLVTHLECGHAYFVKLKSGSQTSDNTGDIEIPNLTFTNFETTEEYLLSLTCGGGDGGGPTDCSECPGPDVSVSFDVNPAPNTLPLGLSFTVNTDILKSQCSSNKWKYSIAKKGSQPFKTSSATSLSTTLINETVDEGNIDYVIEIWGVNDAGSKITPTPNVSAEVEIGWPSSNFSIVGGVNISYLEHEGPKSTSVTPTDPDGWVERATLIPAAGASNISKWKYSLNNSEWFELSDLTTQDVNINSPLYFRLKVDQLGGVDHNDNTTLKKQYNSEVVVEYEENNGDVDTKTITLSGEVLNRIIGLTSWVDKNNTDFKATLTISKNQLTRWQYQLEKLNDDEGSYDTPKILTPYGPGTIQSDTSEEINLQTHIESNAADMGPGYYKISVRGVHNTDDDVVVTPELSLHDFFNWPNVLYTLNGAINNSYREYEGPQTMSTFYFVSHNYFNNWKFEIVNNADAPNWQYQNSGGSITGPLPTTPTDVALGGIGFRMIEGKKASATPTSFGENTDQAYSTDIKFYIYGKNAIPTLADPADPVEVTKTIKTTVIERYLTNTNQTITPHPNQNLITIKVDFGVNEMNRWQPFWLKGTTSLASPGVQTATGYSSNTSDEYIMDLTDVSSDYLTANNTFNFKVIGYSTTDTGTTHESGWVANQVAPTLEDSFTIDWPTTIFTINHANDTISDNYIWQGVTATPATNGKSVSITKGWLKLNPAGNGTSSFTLTNAGGSQSNWEYSTNGESSWVSLDQLPSNFPLYTQSKFRLKANLEVGDYDATIDVVATDIQSVLHTKTINLNGSVTKPTPIFTISPTSISGEYRETEGPSAEKTITISTQFLSSVKWKTSGEIYWEYLDGTWKDLPTDYVTILNKPFQANQTHSAQQSLTIKVRLKAGLEVPGADHMNPKPWDSASFNNVITFEALSSHGDDVTAGKQVVLNGTVTEYPNGCADYDLSFATTGGQVDYDGEGVSINGFQLGGYLCVNDFGTFGADNMSFEVRNAVNEIVTTGTLGTNNLWTSGKNIVYKASDQKAYEAKNFVTGSGNIILTPMTL